MPTISIRTRYILRIYLQALLSVYAVDRGFDNFTIYEA